jgi:TrmH family RNA methyltransferase
VPDITSRQHAIVARFRSAERGDDDHALLDGWHLLHEAAAAGVEITTVAIAGAQHTDANLALIDRLARTCDVFTVTTAVMDAMSPVRTPSGVVALARRRAHSLRDLLRPQPALVLVAADIQDPGNAGAIVRSAEAGGSTGVVFVGGSADPWGWKALRAAMGSTFRLPVLRADLTPTLAELSREGIKIVATVPRGGRPMHEVQLGDATAIVLGAEGRGLSDELVAGADERLTIPMRAPVESLNVASAAAVLVYEARRQREV